MLGIILIVCIIGFCASCLLVIYGAGWCVLRAITAIIDRRNRYRFTVKSPGREKK